MRNTNHLHHPAFKSKLREYSGKSTTPLTSGLQASLLIAGLIILTGLSGCGPQKSQTTLPVDTTQTFSHSGEIKMPARWWTSFEDEALNTLVDSALTANLDIRRAWERLEAAQAVLKQQKAPLFPSVEASLGGEINQNQLLSYSPDQLYQFGVTAGYEVDLWGRIRSRVEAERFRSRATQTDYQTAALSLSAEIARHWYRLIEARNQLQLANRQVKTNEEMLRLMEARFGSGQVRSADILRQRQLLEATREQQTTAEEQVQLVEHRLAVLMGNPPQKSISRKRDSLPQLPPVPETGVPAELIKRRPDVQSAFYRLQAADREVAAAISNQYPRFSLSANASMDLTQIDQLFKDWALSLSGNLLAPIFQGGRLRAEVDRTMAVKNQRLLTYGQTMLEAFQEVEDALTREQKQQQRMASIEKQVELARQTYQQVRMEYFNGMGNYLEVLTALDEVQQLKRSLLAAHYNLLEYRIALYRALAGGFQTTRESKGQN